MAFQLPELPYEFSALEPHIDSRTMEIHHGKHHAGYTKKLNAAIEGTDLENMTIEEILGDLNAVPENIRTAVRNSGGGYYNHKLFWKVMSPEGGGEPQSDLSEAINDTFGSFNDFKEEFTTAAKTRFGSGWAWLVVDNSNSLKVYSTANQDCPLSQGDAPILGLDVWEHAYYLHYQNKRPDYIDAWWNVVNWPKVSENFQKAK